MSSEKNVGYAEKEGTRVVYSQDSLVPIQIRQFRPNAKIGDPVNAYDIIYDENYNIINILYANTPLYVDNLDIRVPEKPQINSIVSNNVQGICVGTVVKDGDIVRVFDFKTKKELGKGYILSNAYSVNIDTSSYNIGDQIDLAVSVENERVKFHGTSVIEVLRYTIN